MIARETNIIKGFKVVENAKFLYYQCPIYNLPITMKVTCSYSYFEQQKKFVLFEDLQGFRKFAKMFKSMCKS